MPVPKDPIKRKLMIERIRQSKLGKKRPPLTEEWKRHKSVAMKFWWARLSQEQREKKAVILRQILKRATIAHQIKAGTLNLTPEEKRLRQLRLHREWNKKNLNKVYAANRKWVKENLERRREIARLSWRRRSAAKKAALGNH